MKSAFKLFALFLIIFLSSCQKEYEDKQTKILFLTKPSGWLTSKIETKGTDGSWIDITNTMGAFDVDNVLYFDPYYKWAIDEGALKFPGNAQTLAFGSWILVDKETKLQFIGGNLGEITELTETTLQFVVVNGSTNRFTYKHP